MQLIISARDQVLARYGNALAALGEGQARTALSRALNHEGNKGRTQVKRALVKQTGIKYGAVEKATATIRATPATLTYKLMARGDESNIAWFGGVQRRKGVSAAPWNRRRIFAHAFIVPRIGRAFNRTSKSRLPIRPLYGPNLARELVKDIQRGCMAERRCEYRGPCRPRSRSHAATVIECGSASAADTTAL